MDAHLPGTRSLASACKYHHEYFFSVYPRTAWCVLMSATAIRRIFAHQILDSRGRPTAHFQSLSRSDPTATHPLSPPVPGKREQLLLKCLVNRSLSKQFHRLLRGLPGWSNMGTPEALEARAVSLLPALFPGRVDSKSPVEYLTHESDKNLVRRVAALLIACSPSRLFEVARHWADCLEMRA